MNIPEINERDVLFENEIEMLAAQAHAANKVICEYHGDMSQPDWDDAPDWQKQSAINGVQHALDNPDATPEQMHENWMKEKVAAGWVFGPVKDAAARTHPCILPYADLPPEQRIKDSLFTAIVRTGIAQLQSA